MSERSAGEEQDRKKEWLQVSLSSLACFVVYVGACRSCSEEPPPRITAVVASDGFSAFLVSCPASHEACFKALGETCPNGYRDVPPATSAEKLLDWDHLIRCTPHRGAVP